METLKHIDYKDNRFINFFRKFHSFNKSNSGTLRHLTAVVVVFRNHFNDPVHFTNSDNNNNNFQDITNDNNLLDNTSDNISTSK